MSVPTKTAIAQKDQSNEVQSDSRQTIRLITHMEPERIPGFKNVLAFYKDSGFRVENFEYKSIIRKKVRRPINPRFKEGPSEEVLVEEKINLNSDFKGLRQLASRVSLEAGNLLVGYLSKIKDESFALPLIFRRLVNANKQILLMGIDAMMYSQLFAVPDLNFKKIPVAVEQNHKFKEQLLKRGERTNGMRAAIRELSDLPYFPEHILHQITQILGGQKHNFTEAELVNILLLCDIHSRYKYLLDTFETDVQGITSGKEKRIPPNILGYIFSELMQEVPTRELEEKLSQYLPETDMEVKNNQQFFSLLYQTIQLFEQKKVPKRLMHLSLNSLFKSIRNIFLFSRSQFDPLLYTKCHILFEKPREKNASSDAIQFYITHLKQLVDEKKEAPVPLRMPILRLLAGEIQKMFDDKADIETIVRYIIFCQGLKIGGKDLSSLISRDQSPLIKLKNEDQLKTFLLSLQKLNWTAEDSELLLGRLLNLQNPYEATLNKIASIVTQENLNYNAVHYQSLTQIFSIHNGYKFFMGRKIRLGLHAISQDEFQAIKTTSVLQLKLEIVPGDEKDSQSIPLFFYPEGSLPLHQLVNSIHFVGRAYGKFLSQRILLGVQRFMLPGLTELSAKYEKNFFEILYETAISKEGLPVSRNQFAQWIEQQNLIGNLSERGWIKTSLEVDFDTNLSSKIISGDGSSVFPLNYTQKDFEKEYLNRKEKLLQLFASLKAEVKRNTGTYNAAKIFLALLQQGVVNFNNPLFQTAVKKTFLFQELQKAVDVSCNVILGKLRELAIHNRIILQVPFEFEPLFFFVGNMFEVQDSARKEIIKAHILPVPVVSYEELSGISREFAENLCRYLHNKGSAPALGLMWANSFFDQYRSTFYDYAKFLNISVIDRLLQRTVIRTLEGKKLRVRHLKHFVKNEHKLMIGKLENWNLSNICDYSIDRSKPAADAERLTFVELLERLQNILTVIDRRKKIQKHSRDILSIVNTNLGQKRTTKKYKRIKKLFTLIDEILSTPLENFDESQLTKLQEYAETLEKYSSEGEGQLIFVKLKKVLIEKKILPRNGELNFFVLFSQRGSAKNDLTKRIRMANKYYQKLRKIKVIVFFPEGAKQFQMDYLKRIVSVLRKFNEIKPDFFIETSSVNSDQSQELAKTFLPTNFFHLDKVEPESP